jgi:hypothetical protein
MTLSIFFNEIINNTYGHTFELFQKNLYLHPGSQLHQAEHFILNIKYHNLF